MNREEYLSIISKKLNRLPKEEYDKAMDYFNEYFDEAGPDNEQKAINDLGDPAAAGDQIIRNLAIENGKREDTPKSVKGNINAVWIGILAVLASPIAFPIAIALIAVVFSLVIAVAAVVFAIGLAGIVLVIVSPLVLIVAGIVITKNFPVFLTCFGAALICLGFGGMIAYGMYLALVALIKRVVFIFGKIANKGGNRR